MQDTINVSQLKEYLSSSQFKIEWFMPHLFFSVQWRLRSIFTCFLWQDFEVRYCNKNINWERWNTEDCEKHPLLENYAETEEHGDVRV